LNNAVVWATAEEIIILEEPSRLDKACRADSSSCPWIFQSFSVVFNLSSVFFNRSTDSSARITWKSRAFDLPSNLLQVATREACVFSSLSANSALASLECWRAYLVACLSSLSSASAWSAANRTDFLVDSALYAAASSSTSTTDRESHESTKEIIRKR
jgi:hypothetical protein